MKIAYLRQALVLVALAGALSAANAAPASANVSVSLSAGALAIQGDDGQNLVDLRRNSQDSSLLDIDIDGDHNPDQTVTLASVKSIAASLDGGDDLFKVTEDGGPITLNRPTTVIGGNGDDTLLGGSGAETLIGGGDRDMIIGGKNNDALFGGFDNDFIRWDVGDGADSVDGGPGDDLLSANGTNAPESFRILREDQRLFLTQSDVLVLDMGGVDRLSVSAMGGNDRIEAFPATGELASLTLDGGVLAGSADDDDEVIGSDSPDTIGGSAGSDKLDGRGGDDTILGGPGDDGLIGGAGHDALTGGAGSDSFECDSTGEALDLEPGELFKGECVAPEPPAGGGETAPAPPAPPAPAGDPLGFAKPSVKATEKGLRVTLRSTSAAPVSVSLKARERFGARRAARYRVVRKTIAAGGRITLTLRAPRALRKRIARQLTLHPRIVRRPVIAVTNTATAGRTTVHPRLTLRVR
jgi:hypothetical protein